MSHRFWVESPGGAADAVRQTVTLDRKVYRIVGVMPPEFAFPLSSEKATDVWIPMGFVPAELKPGATSFAYGVVARIKPGLTLSQAETDVERVAARIAEELPPARRGDLQLGGAIVPLQEDAVGDVRTPLLLLGLAALLVLLIAIVNVANLLLARGMARQRELAIRIALGASARRVVAQLLAESVALGLLGGALGVLLAAGASKALLAAVPSTVPRLDATRLDGQSLAFALALSILAGVAFGVVPAWFAARANLAASLKEGGRGTSAGRRHRTVRSVLVTAQVALALMLLSGAGLLLRSLERVLAVDPGFRPENVISAEVSLAPTEYTTPARLDSFFQQLDDGLERIPGALAAGLSTDLPLETRRESALTVEGYAAPAGAGSGVNGFSFVLGNYFQAMGIPLVRGRFFTPSDSRDAQKVVIISRTLAEKFFAGRDPIGGRLKLGTAGTPTPWTTVVGVVGDVSAFGLDGESLPHTYMPYLQRTPDELKGCGDCSLFLAVRTGGDPASAAAPIRSTVWALDREAPVTDVRRMEEVISHSTAPRRFNIAILGFFAGAALLLAVVGLYGVMSYSVSQRSHEIGVRMTLGARRNDVLRLVLRSGLTLVLAGVSVGLIAALPAARLLRSFLYDVRPSDPLTFVVAAVALALAGLLASLAPALRATRVDPILVLRNE